MSQVTQVRTCRSLRVYSSTQHSWASTCYSSARLNSCRLVPTCRVMISSCVCSVCHCAGSHAVFAQCALHLHLITEGRVLLLVAQRVRVPLWFRATIAAGARMRGGGRGPARGAARRAAARRSAVGFNIISIFIIARHRPAGAGHHRRPARNG